MFAKIFVRQFYRLNAGFFIIIITLTFGFMSGVEHKALAEFFISSRTLTLIPIFIWTVYTIKVIAFNEQRLTLAENSFAYTYSLLPFAKKIAIASQTLFAQLMPVILYGTFLMLMGLKHNLVEPIFTLMGAIALLVFTAASFLLKTLKLPIRERKISTLKRLIDKHSVRPLWWIYITTVLRREPVLFIGTKIFSGLLLFAVMRLYTGESFDERLLGMAASLAGIGNYMILMQLQLFDTKYFSLMRNLPISISVRWLVLVSVVTIINLPELTLLLKYGPAIGVFQHTTILFLIPAIAMTAYSLLYYQFKNEESYSRLMFAITIAHLVLILFKIPIWFLVGLNCVVSWILFKSRYYSFETSPTVNE